MSNGLVSAVAPIQENEYVPMKFDIFWDNVHNDHLQGVIKREQISSDGIPAVGTTYYAPTIQKKGSKSVVVRSISGGKGASPLRLKVEPTF
ncbi:MAG: hypothetical protein UW92_C0033G0001 [Candidatus Jorgensenbacteria bacterium GW2011_GWA2_45_13]|uniref:Uncharacterized protein n=1 Tax=Candidatus Jorgensenbacteria bacterium GW2011_GWA2_45_13 TaxID=1618662 RepID=A0A0G1L3S5_9BACT|nr:MAG: hypothetical protein UW92_C0033G0001 [Candidatus Jorgensenbacteria bacterium GW2011_GWA2_45_13]